MGSENKSGALSRAQAELLLAAVIVARSGSFLLSKIALRTMAPLELLSSRFVLAFAFLVLLFWRRLVRADFGTVWRGLLIGAVFIATMACELMGLRTSDSSRIAFLENSAFVFVPIYQAVLTRRLPALRSTVSVLVTLAGIACLTLKDGITGFAAGDLWGVASAMLYAGAIIITDRAARGRDAFVVGIVQVGGMALFSTLAACAVSSPHLPGSSAEWLCVAGLALVCSGFGFTLQPVAQSGTTAERAGLFCALAPVSAGILGWLVLGERIGARGLIGAALVMTGILIPHFWREKT